MEWNRPVHHARHAWFYRTYDVWCSVARCMISLLSRKNIALCSWRAEMFGAINAVAPQTGRNCEDTVPIL
jgi:hypothetical protein